MPQCEIFGTGLTAGEALPFAKPDWVITSSSNCVWHNSFKVERHLRPAHEQTEMVIHETNVHFYSDATQSPYPLEWRIAGGPLRASSMKAGEIGIVAKDTVVWGR